DYYCGIGHSSGDYIF
nr:immunoglobulin light chain junction region [Macaca mulatta]MOV68585.1 immunoglobulin light chain junction region [Macaca mulatta]MOV69103.1 immunoglobulin light chain junction region [Macaca mulatta]MOV69514.1 immunoglobulin light chain junction region [Macaca mulatta]MOV69842.1 immunoglobulin light chain junction region [Macaca mulatta]